MVVRQVQLDQVSHVAECEITECAHAVLVEVEVFDVEEAAQGVDGHVRQIIGVQVEIFECVRLVRENCCGQADKMVVAQIEVFKAQ